MESNTDVTKLSAEPKPDRLLAIVDTREQSPLDLSPLQSMRGTLSTGDYSLVGLEQVVRIERKSLADLIGCVGRARERFDREVARLLAYPVRALVIEANWDDLESGGWRGDVTPRMVTTSVLSWQTRGLPVLLTGSRECAAQCVSKLLYITARRRWREARALIGSVAKRGDLVEA